MLRLKPFYKVIAASTIGLSVLSATSAAHAANLVPQTEGEIKLTNLACLSNTNPKCIDTSGGKNGYTVTSLDYDPLFSDSRLFVDKRGSANDYSAFGIKFLAEDEGTNTTNKEYWLRPVAYTAPVTTVSKPATSTNTKTNQAAPPDATVGTTTTKTSPLSTTTTDKNGNKITTDVFTQTTTVTKPTVVTVTTNQTVKDPKTGKSVTQKVTTQVTKLVQDITTVTTSQKTTVAPPKVAENGRLEVGKFQFNFTNPLAGLEFKFFDVEDSGHSGILSYTNSLGKTISINDLLTGGKDGNLQTLILKDVKSFVVQLGNPGTNYGEKSKFATGDGADLQLKSVPEPV